jgi:hypothetical protein
MSKKASKELTVDDKLAIANVLDTILGDDDLRHGFRVCSEVNVPTMKRIVKKLRGQVSAELVPLA